MILDTEIQYARHRFLYFHIQSMRRHAMCLPKVSTSCGCLDEDVFQFYPFHPISYLGTTVSIINLYHGGHASDEGPAFLLLLRSGVYHQRLLSFSPQLNHQSTSCTRPRPRSSLVKELKSAGVKSMLRPSQPSHLSITSACADNPVAGL